MKPSLKVFTKVGGNNTSYSTNWIKAKARIRVEPDVDVVLENSKLKNLVQPHNEFLIKTNSRFKHYKGNEDRIILKDDLLFRICYGKTGSVKFCQVLISKHLVNEVLRNLHGELGRHPGVTKTKVCYRQKYYYSKIAQLIKKKPMLCEQCIKDSRNRICCKNCH